MYLEACIIKETGWTFREVDDAAEGRLLAMVAAWNAQAEEENRTPPGES